MSRPQSVRNPILWILTVSAAAVAFLIWWIYFKRTGTTSAEWVELLPALNATFNTLCSCCLVAGYLAIRRGERKVHIRFMLTAVSLSVMFFASYLTYHHYHGDTPFPGQGWIRPVYFSILISHILLSIAVIPMVLTTLFFARTRRYRAHKKLARWTLPVWLYVSVTGVTIFFFLSAYTQ